MNSTLRARPGRVFTATGQTEPSSSQDGLCFSAHLDPKGEMFKQAWAIYNASFNDIERRTLFEHLLVMRQLRYRFSAMQCDGAVVGVLGLWELEGFCFVEHVAVAAEHRSGGYGRRAIRLLQRHVRKPILLDVEPFGTDVNAVRRVAFYRRLGFHYCGYPITLPPYVGKTAEPTNLMSWPMALDTEACERALDTIRHGVYGLEPVALCHDQAV